MDFLKLKSEAFGLDISDLSLKIVGLKKREQGFSLVSFGEAKIKQGIIKKGEVAKEEELVKVIKDGLAKVKGEEIRTKYVIASLPEEKAFLQVIKMPRMSWEDLKSAIIYEAENYIPLAIEDVYFGFKVVPPIDHLKEIEVLIAALPKKTVDPYISCLKKADLKPLALEVESLSIARALIKNEIAPVPILLIDIGATKTGFTVFSGRSVRFTSSIPVCSQTFTDIIAKALKIDQAEAEKLKIKYGLEGKVKLKIKDRVEKEYSSGRVFEALIPALTDLVQQIKKCIDFYQTHSSFKHLPPDAKTIEKVLLCGGGANLKGLPELLSLELKVPVEPGNPRVNILSKQAKNIPQLSLKESLSYTTAIGLALRGVGKR